jgi:hypothetical protein
MTRPVISTGKFPLVKLHSTSSIHTEDGALDPFRCPMFDCLIFTICYAHFSWQNTRRHIRIV